MQGCLCLDYIYHGGPHPTSSQTLIRVKYSMMLGFREWDKGQILFEWGYFYLSDIAVHVKLKCCTFRARKRELIFIEIIQVSSALCLRSYNKNIGKIINCLTGTLTVKIWESLCVYVFEILNKVIFYLNIF